MPRLFALTLFTSATLLFLVQPMVGKLILPLLGGTPAAWTTCMVFFQSLLLVGYLYAHFSTTRLVTRGQVRLHALLLVAGALWLLGSAALSESRAPVAVASSLAGGANPVVGVLGLLAVAIGLPFLVVSTSAPLLTRWFADTNHKSSRDPYFLYAASNAGSLLALLGYPLLVEPTFALANQAWLWAGGYLALAGLVLLCGAQAARPLPPLPPPPVSPTGAGAGEPAIDPAPTTWARRLHWLALAFVPSSLMLGVTTHMTTDVASVPLLWVIPLALYLVSFIVAFARTPSWLRPLLTSAGAISALLLVFVLAERILNAREQAFEAVALNLGVFFVLALMAHVELARLRPDPARLTGYFLWISLGGVLGGVVNGVIAPLVLTAAHEYPATLALACFLVPAAVRKREDDSGLARAIDFLFPLALAAIAYVLATRVGGAEWFRSATDGGAEWLSRGLRFAGGGLALKGEVLRLFAVSGLPCMACLLAVERPLRFGLSVSAVLAIGLSRDAGGDDSLWTGRSYFGVVRVDRAGDEAAPGRVYNRLFHGTTLHGMQDADSALGVVPGLRELGPAGPWQLLHFAPSGPWAALAGHGALTAYDERQQPLTYYHRTGPVAPLIRQARRLDPAGRLGVVGLGSGSIAAYLGPTDRLTYYEIDDLIVDLVNRGDHFTYVSAARARGAQVGIVLGDARLQLERSDETYSLLMVDAFSSDAIPVHMLTAQAIELYKNRLAPRGVLALHVSNSFLDLKPVVARLAAGAGLHARLFRDEEKSAPGKAISVWVALARSEADLGELAEAPWGELELDPAVAAWTDDYADVMSVMTVREVRWVRRRLGLPLSAR